MRTLDLIHELWNASALADRCPHIEHAACGCSCSVAADPNRMVCHHFSLQLWCLAGPDRWPVCASCPCPNGSAVPGRADAIVAYREFADGNMRPVFQDGQRQYVINDDGLREYGVFYIRPDECPGGIIVEATPVA
jgi:hypothetical protein